MTGMSRSIFIRRSRRSFRTGSLLLISFLPKPDLVFITHRHCHEKTPTCVGVFSWQGRQDSNLRPMVLETTTLPTELLPYIACRSFCPIAVSTASAPHHRTFPVRLLGAQRELHGSLMRNIVSPVLAPQNHASDFSFH